MFFISFIPKKYETNIFAAVTLVHSPWTVLYLTQNIPYQSCSNKFSFTLLIHMWCGWVEIKKLQCVSARKDRKNIQHYYYY